MTFKNLMFFILFVKNIKSNDDFLMKMYENAMKIDGMFENIGNISEIQ